jgi:ribonucleoside-diphosphate reductase subunit M2
VHSETYSLLIQCYILDPDERETVFDAVRTMPAVKAKADWAAQWMTREQPFAKRLVAFACTEGILFSGSFCAIFWLKKRGLMPGLSLSNQLISRDEGLHMEFACALYRHLKRRLSDAEAHEVVAGAVRAEEAFICEALPCDLVGINRVSMARYIRFVADRLLASLGHPKLFQEDNPFEWMEMISLQGKTNFFEARVSEYQKSHVMSDGRGLGFSLDEDF